MRRDSGVSPAPAAGVTVRVDGGMASVGPEAARLVRPLLEAAGRRYDPRAARWVPRADRVWLSAIERCTCPHARPHCPDDGRTYFPVGLVAYLVERIGAGGVTAGADMFRHPVPGPGTCGWAEGLARAAAAARRPALVPPGSGGGRPRRRPRG